MKTSQAELNELLTEYWKLRHETGMLFVFATISTDGSIRGLYGNSRKQAWDASSKYMTLYLCRLYVSRAVRSNRVFLVWIANRGCPAISFPGDFTSAYLPSASTTTQVGFHPLASPCSPRTKEWSHCRSSRSQCLQCFDSGFPVQNVQHPCTREDSHAKAEPSPSS